VQNSSALVIGAGGASRAVLGALLSLGVPEICLVNRTDSKAEDLAGQVDVPSLYALPWAQRQGMETLGGLDMLIAQARPSFKLFFGQTPPMDLDPTDTLFAALASGKR